MEGLNSSKHDYLLTQVSKQVSDLKDQVAAQDVAIEANRQSAELNSRAITNDSVQSINRDTALGERISNQTRTQIEDKAYLVGEIERHHAEHSQEMQAVNTRVDTVDRDRIAGEARIFEITQEFQDQLGQDYRDLEGTVATHEGILDVLTWDSDEFTLDSEEYRFDWSMLSASQEWRLEIAKFFKDAEDMINDKIAEVEGALDEANDKAGEALENSDIDKIVEDLLGKVGSDFLDDALAGRLNDFAEDIIQERKDRIADILKESNTRIEEMRNLHNQITHESVERVDSIAHEAETRNEQFIAEAETRAKEIADEAEKWAEALSKEITDRNAALDKKAGDLQAHIDAVIKELNDGYTKRFELIESNGSKTLKALEAYKVSNDKSVAAVTKELELNAQKDATTLKKVDALQLEYDQNKVTVGQQIKANADANKATVQQLNTFKTEVNKRDQATGELIKSTKAEILKETEALSTDQKATVQRIEKFQSSYNDRAKTIDGKLTDVDGKFNDVDGKFKDVAGQFVAVEGQFTEMSKSISDVNGNITSTAQKLESQYKNEIAKSKSEVLTEVSTQTKNLDGKITNEARRIDSLNGSFNGLSEDLKKNVQATATAQETANTAVSATESLAQNIRKVQSQTLSSVGVRAIPKENGLADWTFLRASTNVSFVKDEAAMGGVFLQMGRNVKDQDQQWAHWNQFEKIDPNKLYRLRVRYRRVEGDGGVYVGVTHKNADQSRYVTSTNVLNGNMGSANYVVSNYRSPLGEMMEQVFYFKGKSTGAASGRGTFESPRTFPALAEYFAPMCIANYTSNTGITQFSHIIIEDDESLAASNDANAHAIELIKTVTKDGEATSERTNQLESQVKGVHQQIITTEQQLGETSKKLGQTEQKLGQTEQRLGQTDKKLGDAEKRLDANGNLINSQGKRIDQHGNLLTTQGNRLDEQGNLINAAGKRIDQQGNLINDAGKRIDEHGNLLADQGNRLDEQGNLINAAGKRIDAQGNLINDQGKRIDEHGNLINDQGKRIDAQGNLIDAHGKRIADTEGKILQVTRTVDSHAKALTTFATKTDLEKSEANQSTKIESNFKETLETIRSATGSDSLARDYFLANPDDWESHYGYSMGQYFYETTTGKVGTTLFRKDSNNPDMCWNYNKAIHPNTRAYRVSFLVRRSTNSTGACYVTILRSDKTGKFARDYTHVSIPVAEIPVNSDWVEVSRIVNMRSTAAANPLLRLGFAVGHTGKAGSWEVQGFRVDGVMNENDVDTTLVKSSVLVSYATKTDVNSAVSNATTTLTSQYKKYADDKAVDSNKYTDDKAANVVKDMDAKLTNNYYTKADADKAVAGEISKFGATVKKDLATVDASIRKDTYTKADTDAAISSGLTRFESDFTLGGVNLLTDGGRPRSGANEYLQFARTQELTDIYSQGECTISFDMRTPVPGQVQVYASNNAPMWTFDSQYVQATEVWARFSVTVRPRRTNHPEGLSCLEFYGTYKTGRIVHVRNVKIERGKKATAWSPSAGDIANGFADAIEESNKINANLTNNYFTKAGTNSAIASASTALETKMNGNVANTLKSYYNKTEADRVMATKVEEFRSTLKIGGGNLLKNSNFTNGFTHWGAWGGTNATRTVVKQGTKNWACIKATSNVQFKGISTVVPHFEPGAEYTLSFDAYALVGEHVQILTHQVSPGNNNPQPGIALKVTKTPARYSFTFKAVDDIAKTGFNIHISGLLSQPYEIYLANIQLEVGNIATAWGESADEIYNNATAEAQKYTDASVKKVDDKLTATSTDLTKLKSVFGEVTNYTISSVGGGSTGVTGFGGIKDVTGKIVMQSGRGLNMVTFNGNALGSVRRIFDTYTNVAHVDQMIQQIKDLPDNTYVVVMGYDSFVQRMTPALRASMCELGASKMVLESLKHLDSYILVGRKGLSEGQGTEIRGAARSATLGGRQIDYLLQMINGVPAGLGSSAPAAEATNILSTKVEEVDGRVKTQAGQMTQLQSSMNTANGRINDVDKRASDAEEIARAGAQGKLVHGDPTFKRGTNQVVVYDNARTGRVKVERIPRWVDNPTTSTHQVNVTVTNGATPGLGGFYVFGLNSRANAVWVTKYLIKLPVGYSLGRASNSIGTGGTDVFVGNVAGTGKYETYYRVTRNGATGPFGTHGHVYVTGGNLKGEETMTFPIAMIEVFDMTDYQAMSPEAAESMAQLTEMANTSATEHQATADKLLQLKSSFHPQAPNGRMPQARDESKKDLWTYILCKLKAGDTPSRQFFFQDVNTAEIIRKGEVVSSTGVNKGTWFPETQAFGHFRTWVYMSAAKTVNFTRIDVDDAITIYVNNQRQYLKIGYGNYADCSLKFGVGWSIIDVFVGNGASAGGFTFTPLLETQVTRMCPVKLEDILDNTSASVLQGYTTHADMNSAIATASTTLESKVKTDLQKQFDEIKLDRVTVPDTRNVNQPPQWYWTNYPRSVVTEFKSKTAIGNPSGTHAYGSVETIVPWNDASGGPIVQRWTANGDAHTRFRQSVGTGATATWSAWNSAIADAQVKITEQTQAINGIKGVKGVSIDNNGVLCGVALTSELVNGVVQSAFGVSADQFYVGSPKDGRKVFAVVDGKTVIHDAIIGNLNANKINTGEMHGDRIMARTLRAEHLTTTALEAIAISARHLTLTAPDGSKTVQTGGLTEIFYPNGQLGIRLGIR